MPYKDPVKLKEYHKKRSAQWYQKNKELTKERGKQVKKLAKQEWIDFKATLSCVQCGQTHPATFDFHHVNPKNKVKSVNEWVQNRNYKQAYEEIKKCIVLCANCHRIHHYNEKRGHKAPDAIKHLD